MCDRITLNTASLPAGMRAVWALLALLCISGAAAQANAPLIQGESGGWRQGRATFYGGPERFLQNFADRGPPPEYGFGNAIFGSCGYTQQVSRSSTQLLEHQTCMRLQELSVHRRLLKQDRANNSGAAYLSVSVGAG